MDLFQHHRQTQRAEPVTCGGRRPTSAQGIVLVVEDEPDIRKLISYSLRKEGYETLNVDSGEAALDELRAKDCDLVVLDLMLPGMNGLEVCRAIRSSERLKEIPIIMLTAKTEEADMVRGLERGADDYIPKPFSPKVLVARVGAVLRRFQSAVGQPETGRIIICGLEIDPRRHAVLSDGASVDLSATEFSILAFLAANPGWVYSRSQIINAVRGEDYPVTERSVDVQILGIRRKLGAKGRIIETVRGVGYRVQEEKHRR